MNRKIRSFKARLILFFVIIVTIVLVLQVGVSQYLISSIIVEKSNANFQETVNQIGNRVDLQVKQCEEIVQGITKNQVLKNYLKDLKYHRIYYQVAKYKIMREILRLTNLETIESIHVFIDGYAPINCYYENPILEIDSNTQYLLLKKFSDFNEEFLWSTIQPEPFQISVFSYIHTDNENLGLLKICFNEKFLNKILDEAKLGKEGKVYLIDSMNKVVFTKDRNLITKPFLFSNYSSESILKYQLTHENWSLLGVIPRTEIASQITQINYVFLIMVIIVVAAIIIFATAAVRAILRPLNKIMKGMEYIQQGNLNVILENDSYNEFSFIIKNFNYMVERIKSLVETVYYQQIHYRKAEMSALRAKLNPHFLYNTLDAIYWMLIIKGEEGIAKVIVALSNILRYSISHENEFVTVREDMGQLENYLEIQKMRFDDKLSYSLNLSEEITELKVPKLLIQPLVENSIKHGFQDMKHSGMINIKGYLKEDDLFFEVTDNGEGMTEEKVQAIFSTYEFQSKKTGIGIKMVHNRIKYIYGDGYGISIDSTPDRGTKITVRMGKKAEFNKEELLGS